MARDLRARRALSRIFLISAVLTLGSPNVVQAAVNQWSTNGPYCSLGDVVALAMNPAVPTTLYAVTNSGSGLYVSTDAGATWTNKLYTGLRMYAVAVDPTNPAKLYVGTDYSSVLRSSDGGETWQSATFGPPGANSYVQALAIDRLAPNTIYAGLSDYSNVLRLYKSTDGGVTWTGLAIGSDVFVIALDPTTSGTVYAGTSHGVYKSTNGGATWSNLGVALAYVFGLAIDPTAPSIVYAGSNLGVFKSTDGGSTWNQIRSTPTYAVAVDPNNHTFILAATNGSGVIRTGTSGLFWGAVNNGLTNLTAHALLIDPSSTSGSPAFSTTAYVVTDGGVFKTTTNLPPNWSALTVGRECQINAVAVDPVDANYVYAASKWDGLFRSSDAGTTWTASNPNPTCVYPGRVKDVAVVPTNPATVYVAAGACVSRSNDRGATWTSAALSSNYSVNAIAIDPGTPSILYAARDGVSSGVNAADGGVVKSIDGGATWNAAVTGWPNPHQLTYALAIDPATPSTLYAGTEAGVFRSTDGAATWSAMNAGLTNLTINGLAVDPADPSTVYAATSGKLFKSTGGGSWTAISNSLVYQHINAVALDPAAPNPVLIAAYGGIFQTVDGGGTWDALSDGLLNRYVNSITTAIAAPGTLYASSEGGVFERHRAVPTPTATVTATTTATATETPTATAADTATPTDTATIDPTATFTPVPMATATDTATAVSSATATPTSTSTDTPIATASATPTNTATPEPSSTPTPTAVLDQCTSAAPLNDCVAGGGVSQTDCTVELLVQPAPPRSGRGVPRNRVDCYEGDACDADPAIGNHQCRFDLRLCINNHDARLPACAPSDLASLEVLKPSWRSADPTDLANRAALESSAGAGGFGVSVLRAGSAIFTGTDNADADRCGDPIAVLVPLRQLPGGTVLAANRKIRIRSLTSSQSTDTDIISFRCRPSTCGNSIVEHDHETCDDGNRLNGDGCNQACQLE